MQSFLYSLRYYILEIVPVLLVGFLISGVIQEYISIKWVEKNFGKKGILPIFYSTLVGIILPICCWGALPIALTFYKKGSKLGPVLAFLVATPATSVSALLVSYKLLGRIFTLYIFIAVVIMGITIGLLGNFFKLSPKKNKNNESCPSCKEKLEKDKNKKKLHKKIISILRFAFIEMPREIGAELFLGIILAAIVVSAIPAGRLIENYFSGFWSYPFSVIFGLIMYFCSTASIPLIDALIVQGINIGAALTLLIIGPITSYGTILVFRKEFGYKILSFYLISICTLALILGYIFYIIYNFLI